MCRNDSASATISAFAGASVEMKVEISRRGAANIVAAEAATKAMVNQNAVQPARETAARSRAPKAWPTRTLAACPRPSGTMNAVAAICITIACASIAAAPISPIASAAKAKVETSAAIVKPMGTPSRQISFRTFKSSRIGNAKSRIPASRGSKAA